MPTKHYVSVLKWRYQVCFYVCIVNMPRQETIWFIGLLYIFACIYIQICVDVWQCCVIHCKTEIISAMNYACIYVRINSPTVFSNTIPFGFEWWKTLTFAYKHNNVQKGTYQKFCIFRRLFTCSNEQCSSKMLYAKENTHKRKSKSINMYWLLSKSNQFWFWSTMMAKWVTCRNANVKWKSSAKIFACWMGEANEWASELDSQNVKKPNLNRMC